MPRRQGTCFARIEPLCLHPAFHRLTGAQILLVGGGDGAAWKAQLRLAAGAQIRLVATERSSDLETPLSRRPEALKLIKSMWPLASFSCVRLAVMNVESDIEAARFEQAGRMTGASLHIIDRPEPRRVQFGSILNRAPATISISTVRATPVVGQAIRRRIEPALPCAKQAAFQRAALKPSVRRPRQTAWWCRPAYPRSPDVWRRLRRAKIPNQIIPRGFPDPICGTEPRCCLTSP